MKLQDVLDGVRELDDTQVIYAKKPWLLDSDAVVGSLEKDMSVPSQVLEHGFSYFIEVSVAIEVLECLGVGPIAKDQQRSLLIYYAENDAYPEWAFNNS